MPADPFQEKTRPSVDSPWASEKSSITTWVRINTFPQSPGPPRRLTGLNPRIQQQSSPDKAGRKWNKTKARPQHGTLTRCQSRRGGGGGGLSDKMRDDGT
ncbi:hypothetical protein ACOMHN_065437 [Nucella lapillus]